TGLIGSKVVENLKALGHEAMPASPRLGIDTLTGKGLPRALADASVVVDVSNSPSFEDSAVMSFFVTSTRNLLEAEKNAGVGHHVALSIVGIDRSPDNGYFKAKLAQEALIDAGPIPFTIVRSTQFMEFVDGIADSATTGNEVHMAPVAFQPIAAEDVARAVTDAAINAPVNGRVEIAGPDRLRFDEVIGRKLSARNDPRVVVSDPNAIYFGAVPSEDSLVPLNGARLGAIHYDDWLRFPTTR
ncbi:MAG TPA: SDR family oxidoreductase, partial [Thermomicrobiales bacterium]|nr:SDR family oxidoreductase [Thermomicrobiales bacterium]